VALLENPIGTRAENYLTNGNRLLLDLFNVQVEMVDALTDPTAQLDELATRLEAQGFRPTLSPSAVRTRWARWGMWKVRWKSRSSARRGEPLLRGCRVRQRGHACRAGGGAGTTAAGRRADWRDGVPQRRGSEAESGHLTAGGSRAAGAEGKADILLWDDYFAPGYGTPNEEGMEAVKLLARLEGILLDPVYTGKAMAGLIDGIAQKRFKDEGPILFVHTGGAPALFAYHPHV
jgi:D-cysteine desulfhydrase